MWGWFAIIQKLQILPRCQHWSTSGKFNYYLLVDVGLVCILLKLYDRLPESEIANTSSLPTLVASGKVALLLVGWCGVGLQISGPLCYDMQDTCKHVVSAMRGLHRSPCVLHTLFLRSLLFARGAPHTAMSRWALAVADWQAVPAQLSARGGHPWTWVAAQNVLKSSD